jgi:hypothetical protein
VTDLPNADWMINLILARYNIILFATISDCDPHSICLLESGGKAGTKVENAWR